MSKLEKTLNWGVGAFEIIMKNKLVAIGCFLVPGVMHTFNPVGSLDWDTMMLSILLIAYATISIVFVLTNKNKVIGKGRDAAGDFVKGYFDGQIENSAREDEVLSKNHVLREHIKNSNERLEKHVEKLKKSHKDLNKPERGKVALFITYLLLLAFGIVIFIWRAWFVGIVQIIFGALLIADGIMGIATFAAAVKNKIEMKGKVASLIISIFTVLLGIVFIILPDDTAPIVYCITGILLIIKAVADFIVMIRNKEVLSSIKDTFKQIKDSSPSSEDTVDQVKDSSQSSEDTVDQVKDSSQSSED